MTGLSRLADSPAPSTRSLLDRVSSRPGGEASSAGGRAWEVMLLRLRLNGQSCRGWTGSAVLARWRQPLLDPCNSHRRGTPGIRTGASPPRTNPQQALELPHARPHGRTGRAIRPNPAGEPSSCARICSATTARLKSAATHSPSTRPSRSSVPRLIVPTKVCHRERRCVVSAGALVTPDALMKMRWRAALTWRLSPRLSLRR